MPLQKKKRASATALSESFPRKDTCNLSPFELARVVVVMRGFEVAPRHFERCVVFPSAHCGPPGGRLPVRGRGAGRGLRRRAVVAR